MHPESVTANAVTEILIRYVIMARATAGSLNALDKFFDGENG